MARPLRIQYENAYYHVTCRGNARARIFLNDYDEMALRDILESLRDILESMGSNLDGLLPKHTTRQTFKRVDPMDTWRT